MCESILCKFNVFFKADYHNHSYRQFSHDGLIKWCEESYYGKWRLRCLESRIVFWTTSNWVQRGAPIVSIDKYIYISTINHSWIYRHPLSDSELGHHLVFVSKEQPVAGKFTSRYTGGARGKGCCEVHRFGRVRWAAGTDNDTFLVGYSDIPINTPGKRKVRAVWC